MAAQFLQDLWESIFTPGPTASILKATNVSFASLQLVLFVLLIATYSIHFLMLSLISAGLWWAINWFAAELKASQEREEREKAKQSRDTVVPATSDSETEVEQPTPIVERPRNIIAQPGPSREVEPLETKGQLKHRAAAPSQDSLTVPAAAEAYSGTQSSVSTEDEWEKVSESENDKDK